MLHRLALRIIPNLAMAVTEPEVRKRKRLVMLVPGLVAFGVYRAVKQGHPLDDAVSLLGLSALLCALTALCAYRVGRGAAWRDIVAQDGLQRLLWVAGWVGVVYGVQLSLLVLALCLAVTYDFHLHPSGPAMMALIIASTSVARDGFEVGIVRRRQHDGRPVLTFPDGASFRTGLTDRPGEFLKWGGLGVAACAAAAWAATVAGPLGLSWYLQLAVVTLLAGSLALPAYLDGQGPGQWLRRASAISPAELLRFWGWPGLWFAATYYLVLVGAVRYPLGRGSFEPVTFVVMAGIVGGMMTLYSYYLGGRRRLENRILGIVPDTLLRCPFIMGILSKDKPATASAAGAGPPPDVTLEHVTEKP